ncbi:MAG TPA: DUF5009 domain-containing protein, partial [Puia sp.]|nr:DUF5009 domain-containing protein [Puia sp.]
ILVMVFVNELAGIREIPAWMKHMRARADAMSFVDIVFPAFLFIAGMSIPFALNNRILKGDRFIDLQKHIIFRTIGLLVMGFFMVNAEGGGRHTGMPINIHLWALLFFIFAIVIWNVYQTDNKKLVNLLRGIGIVGLIILSLIYRGGPDGNSFITPKWWGILGLIGWAYLFCCLAYQLSRGKIAGLLITIVICTAFYAITKFQDWEDYPAKQGTHITVMTCGIITSLIFFDESRKRNLQQRFVEIICFAVFLFFAGFLLRPYYPISKIYATPTWGFYCAAICSLLYALLYWLVDLEKVKNWTGFFKPAASNPLLTYIIPDIIFHLTALLHISLFPRAWRYGLPGMIWSAFFAVAVMYIATGLNRLRIRLQL